MHPTLKKGYWSLVGLGVAYLGFIGALCVPVIQRNSIYANKFVSAFWVDLDTPSKYGFAENQVTPFNIKTPDGETLYCWHVMPLQLYAKHEQEIRSRASESKTDFKKTVAYDLLKADEEARVIINFHGNAGNLAQGWRTSVYSSLTSTTIHTHLMTCDYRGFGRSTGTPTEAGVLTDGISLVTYALDDLAIPSQNMMLLGQSLGTAVASGVALWFANPQLGVSLETQDTSFFPSDFAFPARSQSTHFASVSLSAAFTSIPDLMHTYRIMGAIPILSPLRPYPWLQKMVIGYTVDTWETCKRLEELVRILGEQSSKDKTLLQIIHSRDDHDITFRQSLNIFERVSGVLGQLEAAEKVTRAVVWDGLRGTAATLEKGAVEVELTISKFGGHNRANVFAPVALAVMRALKLNN